MGIFDFVAGAGAKLFGATKPEEAKEVYKPLAAHVEENGISAKGLSFRFENGALIAEGNVPTQEIREKVILIVGNVEGVSRVDDRLTVGTPAPVAAAAAAPAATPAAGGSSTLAKASAAEPTGWSSKTYTVKKGDTLSAISKEMYGNANKYQLIFEANQPMLKHPDKIYPGQVLRIPPLPAK